MQRIILENLLKSWMSPELYDDYCPNGLQVEGKDEIKKIVFAVSATRESVEKSAELKACALIVHHGLFWKFHGSRALTGPFFKRVKPLIKNDINLFGYHLPLDANMEFGNARALADMLSLKNLKPFGPYKKMPIGISGEFEQKLTPKELQAKIKSALGHEVLASLPSDKNQVTSIGIITGGAKDEWRMSLEAGLDAYLTGEMSEHHYHEAREAGICMYAAGHHATEKWGIQMLMKKIQNEFPELECVFIDSDNPA